jgi:hypothetical protein
VATVTFVVSQLRTNNPIMDPTLFLNPQFTSAALVAFAFGAGTFATNYCIPVMMQTVQGFTPIKAGAVLVPAGLMLLVLIPIAGWVADRVPNHIPISIGCVIFAAAMYLLADSDVNSTFWVIAMLILFSRFGHGIVKPNMGRAALMAVTTDKINQGVGTYNFIRQLGGAFGVSTIAVMIETRTAFHSEALTATQTAGNPTSQEFIGKVEHLLSEAGVPSAVQHSGALDYLGKVVYAQATTMGFQDAFMILAVFFALMLIPCWILSRASKQVNRGGEAKAALNKNKAEKKEEFQKP